MSLLKSFWIAAGACLYLWGRQTPATELFRRWLEVFNSGDRARVAALLQAHYPSALQRLEAIIEIREASGGFELVRIESAGLAQLGGILKEREGDEYARFEIKMEPDQPETIRKLAIGLIPAPPGLPRPG